MNSRTTPAHLPDYAELHCLSNFSFLRGASHAQELVRQAARLRYCAIAITDECSMAGVVRAHSALRELREENKENKENNDIPLPSLIIGTEVRLSDGPKLVLLATDRAGYGRLCALITLGRMRSAKGRYSLSLADLDDGLPGCLALLVPRLGPEDPADARWLTARFPERAWIAVELLRGPDDLGQLNALRELGKSAGLPLVAAGDVHMHVRSRRRLQDVLTAVRLRKPVHECGHALFPSGERHLRPKATLLTLYPPDLLAESVKIARLCTLNLNDLKYEYPEEIVPTGQEPHEYLRDEVEKGLKKQFPEGVPDAVREQVKKELDLIRELGYERFFLTVYDIVNFARSKNILCQGRGSAANSTVCWALRITTIETKLENLLFERFLTKERNEPPDIDVDFEHERREEVIQYIYEKYGRHRTALAATVISYRPKSALRDVGKALGLEPHQADRLSASLAWWDNRRELPQRVREAGFDPGSPTVHQLLGLVETIVGFPRHLSQHVGGFVISGGPLSELVPIENAAMDKRSIIQWDKDDLDELGLLKVDVLALGMLSVIRRALEFISKRRGEPWLMERIPREDPKVYEMIGHADTVGVFQIESRAQMSMLPRLKPKDFYDLVIEIAIVRPGPIQGDMVHPYLRRRQGLEPVTYPSEAVRAVLERTLGVPIFQEQVMKLAIVAAGFSAGDADKLRRSMAAWRRKGNIEEWGEKVIQGLLRNGYPKEFAGRIKQQIMGFGEYGFPESHSASFALLAYVSAWIKLHEPAAFLAGLINSQPMGFYAPAQLVQDARRHGVEVRPVDVSASDYDCTLENDAVRLGLRMIKGLSEAGAQRIAVARAVRAFESVHDIATRAQLDRRDLRALSEAGAFASISEHRRVAYWEVAGIEAKPHLLRDAPVDEARPALAAPTEGQNIVSDFQRVGLTLGRHPLALLRRQLSRLRLSTAEQLRALPHGRAARTAGLVIGRQRPGTASGVVFVTLEDETGCVNVVVWNHLVERQRKELLGSRLMGVEGVLEREGEVVHLVAKRLVDRTAMLGRLPTSSRDFH
jgi:error-prone DNA polymerase